MFGKTAILLLLGACRVQHAYGVPSVTPDPTGVSAASNIDDIREKVRAAGGTDKTRLYYFISKCDGSRTFVGECKLATIEACDVQFEYSSNAGEMEEGTVVASDEIPTSVTVAEDGANAFYNALSFKRLTESSVCRSNKDSDPVVASWTEGKCECPVKPEVEDSLSFSTEDSVMALLEKVQLVNPPTQDANHRVIIVASYWKSDALAGCATQGRQAEVLAYIDNIGSSPTCTTGTQTEVTLGNGLKGCSFNSLHKNLPNLEPPAGTGAGTQVLMYYTHDQSTLLSPGQPGNVIAWELLRSSWRVAAQRFTTLTPQCIADPRGRGSDCGCTINSYAFLAWHPLISAASSKTDLYSTIEANLNPGQRLYLIDETADGCLSPNKAKVLAALEIPESSCADASTTVLLGPSGVTACEKIALELPTEADTHTLGLYVSLTDLPADITAENRDGTDAATFLESLKTGLTTLSSADFCFRPNGESHKNACRCLSADLSDTVAEDLLSNVLVRGYTDLAVIDADAASGTDIGGCAAQSPAPAGKVLAYVTDIARGSPMVPCSSRQTTVSFREDYKGCANFAYEAPAVKAGERGHELRIYAFYGYGMTDPDSIHRDNGNEVATAIEALTNTKTAIACVTEGITPPSLSAPSTGDTCTCPAPTQPPSNSAKAKAGSSSSNMKELRKRGTEYAKMLIRRSRIKRGW